MEFDQVCEIILRMANFDESVWKCDKIMARKVMYQDLGYVDSLNYITFISEIESEFKINLSFEDLESDNFRTVEGIAQIVLNKCPQ